MVEKILKKRRPPKGYRLWPEIRRQFLQALKEIKPRAPRMKELQAIHGAMLMWASAKTDDRLRWMQNALVRETVSDAVRTGGHGRRLVEGPAARHHKRAVQAEKRTPKDKPQNNGGAA